MPVFRSDRVLGIARNLKTFLKRAERGVTTHAASPSERQEGQVENQVNIRQDPPGLREKLENKRREIRGIKKETRGAEDEAAFVEQRKRRKRLQQEIFQLEEQLRAAEEGAEGEEPTTGALPDFVVIGAQKCGTTSLYHLLSQHPLVEPAAAKELRFFDNLFEEGVEWYRSCFPKPRLKDGRKTITGEGTPYYLFHPHAARRMAEVVPQARLIALLRNPVDRAFSHYQMMVRRGFERLGFEEAIASEEARLRGEKEKLLEDEHYDSLEHQHFSYLSRGIYVDQLLRWTEFFDRAQLLVLKSEELSERPVDTFRHVFDFLDLPDWKPETWEVRKKGGKYNQKMDPATRRRLEEYFEPHNRRLYEFLGRDLGW